MIPARFRLACGRAVFLALDRDRQGSRYAGPGRDTTYTPPRSVYDYGIKWLHMLQKSCRHLCPAKLLIVQSCLDLRDDTVADPSSQAPYYLTIELVKPFLFKPFLILSFLLDADVHDETWNLQTAGCWKALCVTISTKSWSPYRVYFRFPSQRKPASIWKHVAFIDRPMLCLIPRTWDEMSVSCLSTTAMIGIDWIWSGREIQTVECVF